MSFSESWENSQSFRALGRLQNSRERRHYRSRAFFSTFFAASEHPPATLLQEEWERSSMVLMIPALLKAAEVEDPEQKKSIKSKILSKSGIVISVFKTDGSHLEEIFD